MNNIPLPKSNEKKDIDTTIIAIKNYLDDLRRQLGLDKSETTDLSGYATKAELEDAVTQVETDLAPVDEVIADNMQSVTSDAVAESISYSETEVKTGGEWIDGKTIYRRVIKGTFRSGTNLNIPFSRADNHIDKIFKIIIMSDDGGGFSNGYCVDNTNRLDAYYSYTSNRFTIRRGSSYPSVPFTYYIMFDYTKTTD